MAEAEFRLNPETALHSLFWLRAANLDRYESSPGELRAALSLNPRLSSAWIHLGLDAEADGNPQEAEMDLLQAARVDHLYLPAWTLANFYFRRGDADNFWPWARRAARLTYDDYRPLLRLADALDTSPQRVALRLGGGAPLLRAYLDLLIGAGRLDSAREIARSAGRTPRPRGPRPAGRFRGAPKVKRALPVSLVLHVLAIALLLTIRTPERPRARFARVTPIASPYRAPAPVKSAQHVQPLRPFRAAARTFHVPDRLPRPAPPEADLDRSRSAVAFHPRWLAPRSLPCR